MDDGQGLIKEANAVEVLSPKSLTKDKVIVKKDFVHYFNKHEINALLARVQSAQHQMLFQFMWRTGCRVSEVVGVKRRDIDFENSTLTIRWLKNRKYNERKVPMHSTLSTPLKIYAGAMLSGDRIFPISRQRVDQLCKKYGFGHAQKLRHSFAVNFLRQSTSPMALVILQRLLGHAQVNTTMEYLKIVPMEQAIELEKVRFD